jgi:hypothetical protein
MCGACIGHECLCGRADERDADVIVATVHKMRTEGVCGLPGPDTFGRPVYCTRVRHIDRVCATVVDVDGVPVNVSWDYIWPAKYALPVEIADGLRALGEHLWSVGDAWKWRADR